MLRKVMGWETAYSRWPGCQLVGQIVRLDLNFKLSGGECADGAATWSARRHPDGVDPKKSLKHAEKSDQALGLQEISFRLG